MDFDEFFEKKKIDLSVLKQVKGALFEELKVNFLEMGERSFDHSYKFLFNKLRIAYPLVIEMPKNESQNIDSQLDNSKKSDNPSTTKMGFKPMFRAK